MFTQKYVLVFLCVLCSVQSAIAKPYQFVTDKTKVTFKLKLFNTIEKSGAFKKFHGDINYQMHDVNKSSLSLKIDTRSLQIELPASLTELGDSDIFQTKKYPFMKFTSKKCFFSQQRDILKKVQYKVP